jgi:hypothetical protein
MVHAPNTRCMSRQTTMKRSGGAGRAAIIGPPLFRAADARSVTLEPAIEVKLIVGEAEGFALDFAPVMCVSGMPGQRERVEPGAALPSNERRQDIERGSLPTSSRVAWALLQECPRAPS